MKLITRDTDYAIRALCAIARQETELTTARLLVKDLKIPQPFLRKILQNLNKKRILRSYKGKGGGFVLAKRPNRIYLLEIIRIFQGPLKINQCLFKQAPCPNVKTCKLKKKIDNIQEKVIAELKNVTLATLIKG